MIVSRLKAAALAVLACWIWIGVPAHADRTDPAPIPKEAVFKLLETFKIGQAHPLPSAVERQMEEVTELVAQTEKAEDQEDLTVADKKRKLLSSKIHEIRTYREVFRRHAVSTDQQLELSANKKHRRKNLTDHKAQIESRFDRVLKALEDIERSDKKVSRVNALRSAKKLLRNLQKSNRQDWLTEKIDRKPTLQQGLPTKLKPEDFPEAPPPKYLSKSPQLGDNMYASLGFIAIAAAPSPTPSQAQACAYTAADLGQSQDVVINDEIRSLAESLGYSPARIYEYVSNEIAFEPYFGSLKGAHGTLVSKSGNATDHASLLIALLRASNVPARYVLGTAHFNNDPRALRWLGAKSFVAAGKILSLGQVPVTYTDQLLYLSHVWVEACVPYGNYRGTAVDLSGYRWVPLDASFKEKSYQPGINTSLQFDYDLFFAKRTNGPDGLPHEKYAKLVEGAVKALPPHFSNNTLQDVAYAGKTIPRAIDILPITLPYQVTSFNSWGTGLSAETSEVPDTHRYKLRVSTNGFSTPTILSMPEVAFKRLTLAYRGSTPADQVTLDRFVTSGIDIRHCGSVSSPDQACLQAADIVCLSGLTDCSVPASKQNINLVPSIKVDGVETAAGGPVNIWQSYSFPQSSLPNYFLRKNDLSLELLLNDVVINSASFTGKIKMDDIYALLVYAYQTSDRFLQERAARLLSNVNSIADPNTNRDETLGEFLFLAGSKYMRYISDAGRQIGEFDGGFGLSGNHMGIAGTFLRTQYIFDLPFAVSPISNDLLIDVPAGRYNNLDITSGDFVWKTFYLMGHAASAYEHYIWQENTLLDAISTVRGIQYAKEKNIEVLTITGVNQSTEIPKLTNNADSALNYSSAQVSDFQNIINDGYTLTLPRSLIQYEDWKGAVWITERYFPEFKLGEAGFQISGNFSGGYTVGSPLFSGFNPSINTGFHNLTNDWQHWADDFLTPPVLNSGVGPGVSIFNTYSGDPVNMVTGNMFHTEKDIEIKGRGNLPIVLERGYNNREAKDGPFGFGWTHSFNHRLEFKDDNANRETDAGDTDNATSSVTWVDGTGAQRFIQVNGDASGVAIGASFTPPPGFFFQTQRQGDGTYTIREKNGLTYRFESVPGTIEQKAQLLSITDRNGNALTMGYTAGNLTSVTDGLGRALIFSYNAANRIDEIRDWSGRTYRYEYDADGNLISFKNPLALAGKQSPVTYEYYTSAAGPKVNHAMKKYTLPRGNGMTFEYYTNGKVFRHYNTLGETTTFTYNVFSRETVQVNPRGFIRRFFFDEYANPIQIIEENGSVREYTYDSADPMNRTSKRDPMGYVTQYEYDTNGNVIKNTNPSGSTIEYSHFNAFNQPGKIKDARGNYSVLKYDARGNLLEEIKLVEGIGAAIDPNAYTPIATDIVAWTINSYDEYGNLLTQKRARDFTTRSGPVVENDYNDSTNGVSGLNAVRITRRGDKNGDGSIDANEYDTANLSYDGLGRVKIGINGDWHATQYQYDDLDRVIRGSDAYGHMRDFAYDPNGNVVGESLALAISGVPTLVDSTSRSYDLSDRKERTVDAGGFVTRYEYDAMGNTTRIINPDGYSLAFEYDRNNNVIKALDREGHAVSRSLDLDGKPRSVIDANGNTARYEYYGPERDGRLKVETDPAGRVTSFDYDAIGNVVTQTDNLGRTTLNEYDELNRRTRAVGPAYNDVIYGPIRPVTRYIFDSLGHLKEVAAGFTDSQGSNAANDVLTVQMRYVYDDFGRKLRETDALGNTWSYEYDLHGNVTKATDAKGQVTQYTWDYGHQLRTSSSSSGTVTYTRNALGQPLRAESPAVTYDYSYDPAHRLQSVKDGRGSKTLHYGYSPGGLLDSLTDTEGRKTNYTYDPVGRLTGIWAPNGDVVAFVHDIGGRLTEKWLPNGVNTRYGYNPDNTLAQVLNRAPQGSIVSQHDYTYDGVGNRSTQIETIAGVTTPYRYVYDSLNRLNEVRDSSTDTLLEGYTYDPLGNRRTQTDGTTTRYFIYDAANQLTDIRLGSSSGNLANGFVYDTNGNLTKKCEGTSVTRTQTNCTGDTVSELAYDAENRLIQALKTGVPTEAYVYDHAGRRISKIVGTAATRYFYSGPDIHAEFTSDWSSPIALYTHGPSWDDPIIRSSLSSGQITANHYYHQDGLGSVVALSDGTGAITAHQRFDAFGNRRSGIGTVPQYGYSGREPDATGLIYYRARYYDPTSGRFTQRDPRGFVDGVNLYAYAVNNPLRYTDPRGTSVFDNGLTNINSANSSYYGSSNPALSSGPFLSPPSPNFYIDHWFGRFINNSIGSISTRIFGGDNSINPLTDLQQFYSGNDVAGDTINIVTLGIGGGGGSAQFGRAGISFLTKMFSMFRFSNTGDNLALGISEHLDDFARIHGARTWKDFPDPINWKPTMIEKLSDPNNRIFFNLDGVDVWQGVSRAASGRGGAVDWELLQIKQNPQWWGNIEWVRGGKKVNNPFDQ